GGAMKIPFKQIRVRLTGLSLPFGLGAQWEFTQPKTPPEKVEQDRAVKLLTYLEDRRVLYGSYALEVPEDVISSVLQIRERLTSELEQLHDDVDTPLYATIAAMRVACRKFLDTTQAIKATTE